MPPVPKPVKKSKEDALREKLEKLKEKSQSRIADLKAKVKKKSKKKPAVTSLKTLRDTAWRLFSKIVRTEEGYICYTCGKNLINEKGQCHAGHYVPRGRVSALRYDRRNVHAQCTVCNLRMSGNLSIYAIKLEAQYGMGILQEFDKARKKEDEIIKDKARQKPLDRVTLIEMIESYKKRLEELNAETSTE